MSKKTIRETAAGGSVGAGSVAVRFDSKDRNEFPTQKRAGSFLDFMRKNNSKIANRLKMKKIKNPFNIQVNENISLDQVYSKLSGIQNQSRMSDDNTETYGVEDDEGNLMKITVRGNQTEEFEAALAQELAEVEEYKMSGRGGHGKNVSMAEVLYNLKQNFDIVNVEFPEIPKDKVYNADKVSDPDELDTETPDPDQNIDNASPEDEEGELDNFDVEGQGEEDENLDLEGGEEDETSPEGEEGEEDLGTEFGGEEEEEENLLKRIVKMLSSEAEARRAKYEAEAEKSRALQAKYSMKAAQGEVEKQEDLLRMEQEMEEQKKKEKEAKKMADLAKFKMRGGVSESLNSKDGFGSFLVSLMELDDLDTETTLRLQRRKPQELEDPVEKRLRQQTLNSERRLLKHREAKEKREQDKEEENEESANGEGRRIAAP